MRVGMDGAVGCGVEKPDALGLRIDEASEGIKGAEVGREILCYRDIEGRGKTRQAALGGLEPFGSASAAFAAGFFEQLTGAIECALHVER